MQAKEKNDDSLPAERGQTDKSLKAERAKADESLATKREKTESKADEDVMSNRAEADQLRIETRLESDNSVLNESLDFNEILLQERRVADEALYIERRHVDSILEGERAQKEKDKASLFGANRKETDQDLTNERRKSDLEIRRAEVAVTTRDEFLAIVSHDLRNPLSAIATTVDILRRKQFYATADEDTKRFLDIIGLSACEALRLVSDLMDMERMAVGKLDLQVEKHNLTEIIRDSVNSFHHHALKKELSLQVGSQNQKVTPGLCDRGRVSQVLSNLIGNAIKFTPSGGTITLTAQADDRWVEISVADTGRGIPEDMLQKVFGRFQQIGRSERHSLGLGLYISKMILEAHGGRIWVESKVGQGSTFHFKLPASQSL